MNNKYKELPESLIVLATKMSPDSQNFKRILSEGNKIRESGSTPVYYLNTEEQNVLVLDYNDLVKIVEEMQEMH
jgi:hypothetical protein